MVSLTRRTWRRWRPTSGRARRSKEAPGEPLQDGVEDCVSGLAVPRMPRGSPGMEGPNPVRYRVLAFDSDANVTTFATHGP